MPDSDRNNIASSSDLTPTLWRFRQCNTLIGVYSANIIEFAICPICCDVVLDPRGSFEAILGLSPGSARSSRMSRISPFNISKQHDSRLVNRLGDPSSS
jgi:Zn-finger nucleic acid-binding protein